MELYNDIAARANGEGGGWVARLDGWDPRARAWVSSARELTCPEERGAAGLQPAAAGYAAWVVAEVPLQAGLPADQPGEYAFAVMRVLAVRLPGGAPCFVAAASRGQAPGRIVAHVYRGAYDPRDEQAGVPPRPVDARALLAALSGGDVRAAGERGWR